LYDIIHNNQILTGNWPTKRKVHMEKIAVVDLPEGYSIWGNKGAVWGAKCHAQKDGESTTLCGVPPLSTNWAKHPAELGQEYANNADHIGCVECVARLRSVIVQGEGDKALDMYDEAMRDFGPDEDDDDTCEECGENMDDCSCDDEDEDDWPDDEDDNIIGA
jgi:hypothetical protein